MFRQHRWRLSWFQTRRKARVERMKTTLQIRTRTRIRTRQGPGPFPAGALGVRDDAVNMNRGNILADTIIIAFVYNVIGDLLGPLRLLEFRHKLQPHYRRALSSIKPVEHHDMDLDLDEVGLCRRARYRNQHRLLPTRHG